MSRYAKAMSQSELSSMDYFDLVCLLRISKKDVADRIANRLPFDAVGTSWSTRSPPAEADDEGQRQERSSRVYSLTHATSFAYGIRGQQG